jgi:inosose dehydratase
MGIRVGNAPVSWAVYEAGGSNPPYGAVLDQIVAAGYDGTELGPYGYLPTEPGALAHELDRRGLALASSFVPLALEDPSRRTLAVETALTVARRTRIAGRVPADGSAGWSDAEWREAAATVHAVAHVLRDTLGMRVVLHHHAGTFVETPAEIDRFLGETDPELVGLLLDTGHAVYGGADPLDVVRRHGPRIQYVHLKDAGASALEQVRSSEMTMSDAWSAGVFCPLGDGVVDFPALAERLRGQGYDGWAIVEQDVIPDAGGRLVPDPFESARRSRSFLRENLGL